jgi:steroid delta-isomerase-like uncharacterized protein
MSRTDENKRLMQRVYEDCFNAGKLEALDQLVEESFQGVQGGRGPAAFAAPVRALRQAFPDLHVLEDVLAEGDRVAVRWKWSGSHEGPFGGHPPTHKRISNEGMAIFQIKDGKIAASWVQTDRLGFLQEIGVVSKEIGARPPSSK